MLLLAQCNRVKQEREKSPNLPTPHPRHQYFRLRETKDHMYLLVGIGDRTLDGGDGGDVATVSVTIE